MFQVVKPPTPIPDDGRPIVFLAGSIDMGAAEDWQRHMELALEKHDVIVCNPRRDDWDSSWAQSIHNDQFREQVEWELTGLERARVVPMYFTPTSKAPITLLELGLCARANKLVVCAPDAYWRSGNVQVVCARYGVPMVPDLSALIQTTIARL